MKKRIVGVAAGALVAALALAGCGSDPLAEQYRSGDGKGYISGSGVTEIAATQRGEPIDFAGMTETGKKVDSAQYRGDVLVVNFWYAQCPPCRTEASDLQTLNEKYQGDGVAFLGVNTRDQAAAAQAFDDEFGITYPSILDADGGAVQLAFSGNYRPNATPTTFVIDQQGRIAARIEGSISAQPSTLDTLIRDTRAEDG